MWSSIDDLIAAWSIENYDFQFSRSEIQPRLIFLFRISFLITLDIYKAYFKSRHIQIQRPRDLFSLWEATGFCNQVLPDLYCWWSEALCSQQHHSKLLDLVTYWDSCKELVIDWIFVHQGKEGNYKIKFNWVWKWSLRPMYVGQSLRTQAHSCMHS